MSMRKTIYCILYYTTDHRQNVFIYFQKRKKTKLLVQREFLIKVSIYTALLFIIVLFSLL